jgi:large subunit ribosomal protein L9
MATKLLLIQDVEDLGRSGDVVSVKPGFARNFLLPKRFAVLADRNALRMQERLQEERRKKAAQDKKEAEAIAEIIDDKTHTIEVKVDPEGHMYGSVSALDIIRLVHEHDGVELERRCVLLEHPIKTTGVHRIEVKLKEAVTASFLLKVVVEGMGDAAEAVTEHAEEELEEHADAE